MKKRQNNSARASALQITLSVALLSVSAILFASSFKAAPPAAAGVSAGSPIRCSRTLRRCSHRFLSQGTPKQDGFYPPLPQAPAAFCGTFANPATITINDAAPASPYPSTIVVSGVGGAITAVTVTLTGLNHTFPADVDMLLVGPTGQKIILVSDVIGGTDWVGINYTIDDAAAGLIPTSGTPVSGTFKPTDYAVCQDPFAAPAPAGPYVDPGTCGVGTLTSAFAGTNPNGTWSLYVVDDAGGDVGNISGGWALNISTDAVRGRPRRRHQHQHRHRPQPRPRRR